MSHLSGCGLCLAGGRLAAMLGPLVFEGCLGVTTWRSGRTGNGNGRTVLTAVPRPRNA